MKHSKAKSDSEVREEWARTTLNAYTKMRGGDSTEEKDRINAEHLITDLLHLVCDDSDSADKLMKQAIGDYLAEKRVWRKQQRG